MTEHIATIILNYKHHQETAACVENAISFGVTSPIIVVDNKSPNDSYKILLNLSRKYRNVHVISTDANKGYAYGNNFGVNYAKSRFPDLDYVVIQNPDVRLISAHTYSHLMAILQSDDRVKLVGSVISQNGVLSYEYSGWSLPSKFYIFSGFVRGNKKAAFSLAAGKWPMSFVDVVAGCFFMTKLDYLDNGLFQNTLFDEGTFLYNEENILAFKLKKLGFREAVSLTDFVSHYHKPENPSYTETRTLFKKISKSNIYMLKKYYRISRFDLIIYYLLHFYQHLVLFYRYFIGRFLRKMVKKIIKAG
ncbi:glycosyltransferase [Sporolactobacillus sp. CQH2019]|uniref:glycosyltransferase n=1 Tax=Sporolactobacillus sp. CQH2019 TaxID=3023512 RepID=UPI002368498F|nr:glycosyltransferase [Sporolactobacillus sp. CQH2019]MDD9148213.1 glycosyltransferase [Sporolactobacillus sp. CQH2019]